MKTRAGGGETERGGKRERVVMVGGNGWEPRFCVSVCAQPLPRKTRSERRWDLISAWRHGRKLVPRGGRGVRGMGGWGLHFMSSQRNRERDSETEQSSSSLTAQPATMADVQSPSVWVPYMNLSSITSALLLPVTLSQWSWLGTSPWCGSVCHSEVSSVQSCICIWIATQLLWSRRDTTLNMCRELALATQRSEA